MDYNTSRKQLIIPEYGRHIQEMVDHVMTIADKEERTQAAYTVIDIMGNLNPHLRDVADFKHKLWDHLAIMSNFQLDIDTPYLLPDMEVLNAKPNRLSYPPNKIQKKHYGKIIEIIINKAIELEAGEEKDGLTVMIANQMKKAYLLWNKDSVADDLIFKDLEKLSNGMLSVKEGTTLLETKDILTRPKRSNTASRSRRKR